MQLGKSLVGALVGGAVGIVALIAIHMLTGWDKAWLAILVAIITGAGVRWIADTRGHASYARGALTALIAILAFLAWYPIQAKITIGTASVAKPIVADRTKAEATEPRDTTDEAATEDAEEPAEPASTPAADEAAQPNAGEGGLARAVPPRLPAQQFSTWDFLWLCIAGLIAYELGRGTAPATRTTGAMGSPDDGPPPVSVGQSASPPE